MPLQREKIRKKFFCFRALNEDNVLVCESSIAMNTKKTPGLTEAMFIKWSNRARHRRSAGSYSSCHIRVVTSYPALVPTERAIMSDEARPNRIPVIVAAFIFLFFPCQLNAERNGARGCRSGYTNKNAQ